LDQFEIQRYLFNGYELVSKAVQGQFGDIRTIVLGVIVFWFMANNLCNAFFTLFFQLLKTCVIKCVKTIVFIPVYMFRACCCKPKVCNLCRSVILEDRIVTSCCKCNLHPTCLVQQLAIEQLVCPGCKEALPKTLYKYNLQAGLVIIKRKQTPSIQESSC